ncbi:MAG: TonB-dependent receptor [Acidobacteria bacterium]|nr:TonB-dependent receptor [Acidobacteriota bacterium]MCB9396511.1 TonB-dependent receptor [Acidobacteriota bacterium]
MKWMLGFLVLGPLVAQDQVEIKEKFTVYASKDQRPIQALSNAVRIITAQEIEDHQWQSLADVLEAQPGFALAQTGGDGQVTRVFLRGAASENVLYLLDGVKMNDPSDVGRGFDASRISTLDLERIELVLGPQSALYGSDASSGVVNLVSKKAQKNTADVRLELGEDNHFRSRLAAGWHGAKTRLQVHGEDFRTDGISASLDNYADPLEADSYRHRQLGLNLQQTLTDTQGLDFSAHITRDQSDLDAFGGDFGDDPNSEGKTDLNLAHLGWRYKGQRYQAQVLGSYSETKRDYANPPEFGDPNQISLNAYSGDFLEFEWRNTLVLNGVTHLVFGLESEREKADGSSLYYYNGDAYTSTFDGDATLYGLFGQIHTETGDWEWTGGLRYDDHDQFGGQTTFNGAATWRLTPSSWLEAHIGTGFRAPSLYQLYSAYGSLDLKAEDSTTYQLGYQFQTETWQFRATAHRSDYRELIDFYTNPTTFSSSYINQSKAQMQGLELRALMVREHWRTSLWAEYLDTEDAQGAGLIRRPETRFGGQVQYRSERWSTGLVWTHTGTRPDLVYDSATFALVRVDLDAYDLVQWHAGLEWSAWRLEVRVENLLDEEIVQVSGYQYPGRRAFLALKYHY